MDFLVGFSGSEQGLFLLWVWWLDDVAITTMGAAVDFEPASCMGSNGGTFCALRCVARLAALPNFDRRKPRFSFDMRIRFSFQRCSRLDDR